MKKTKTQKGITLVALIITIVVLLILAVVAITAIQNDGILAHANNAATKYNQKQDEENGILNVYENYLNNYAGGGAGDEPGPGTQTYKVYAVGEEVTIGTEEFYVIKASDETQATVTLLTKKCIDTENLVQSASADDIEFSSEAYWDNKEFTTGEYYDLVETGVPDESHKAAYKAYMYAQEFKELDANVTGRLMYYAEAEALAEAGELEMLYGWVSEYDGFIEYNDLMYWLGTVLARDPEYYDSDGVLMVDVLGNIENGELHVSDYDLSQLTRVRPVVTISKTALS